MKYELDNYRIKEEIATLKNESKDIINKKIKAEYITALE